MAKYPNRCSLHSYFSKLIKMIEPEIKESSISARFSNMKKSLEKLTIIGMEMSKRDDGIGKITKVPYIVSVENFSKDKTFYIKLHYELINLYNNFFTYV